MTYALFKKWQYRGAHLENRLKGVTGLGGGVGRLGAGSSPLGDRTGPMAPGSPPFIAQAVQEYLTPLINISANGFLCRSHLCTREGSMPWSLIQGKVEQPPARASGPRNSPERLRVLKKMGPNSPLVSVQVSQCMLQMVLKACTCWPELNIS